MKFRNTFGCIAIVFLLSSCYALRAYRFRNFELDDLGKFNAATLEKSNLPYQFKEGRNYSAAWQSYLDSNLQNSLTYGFLVIRNDSILYEKYFGDLDSTNIFPSFSVAKSFVGTLAQIALQEGAIKSFGDPVTDYLPWLLKSDKDWKRVSIQNILDMRSGVESDETYDNPFSDVIKLGFRRNMYRQLKNLKTDARKTFEYKSVNTQLLAAVIEAATGKPLPVFLQEKLWQPLGMESNAGWQTDARGRARAFCCLNATMKDFAKLGRLYLENGNWNGKQILAESWVQNILNTDSMRARQGYTNHWWSSRTIRRFSDSVQAQQFVAARPENWYIAKGQRRGKTYFSAYHTLPGVFAQGMLGQYIYINPPKNLIIVRMGHSWSHPSFYAQRFIEDLAERIN
ncbi:serine hydrolase domain-containing protein [Niabella insulamsoli]|uniref:serine hydrolase domain-containing protein n=1 Tax=Niabella insulamsoli TaxID=3144874 RepID=UPI0031FC7EFE